jgi:uncharacterized protein (TIGR00369 family)
MTGLTKYLDNWIKGEYEPPVTQLIGVKLVDYQHGSAQLILEAGPQHHNPMGIVHGGILCDLADAAMGVAMASVLDEDETFSTIELDIHFFRRVRESLLSAFAKVVQRTSRIGYLETSIEDEQGRLIARATSACLIQSTNLSS